MPGTDDLGRKFDHHLLRGDNGMPLAFIEVKLPNNKDGIQAEHRRHSSHGYRSQMNPPVQGQKKKQACMKIKEELKGVWGMVYGEMKINRGKKGIFEEIEKSSNILCAKGLIACAAVITIIGIIAVIIDKSTYMQFVKFCIAIADVVCIAMAWYSLKRKEHGSLHKYALFGAWSVAICLISSCIDSSENLLYAIPILLAIRYYSVVFTLAVSVLNIIFAFIPYIVKVYLQAFPLDFVVLEEGAVITMAGGSLHGTVNALDSIDITATITNMLSFGYLVTMSILVAISIFAVMLTNFTRKNIIEQYNASRNRIEG